MTTTQRHTPSRVDAPELSSEPHYRPDPQRVHDALRKRSFATLATTSPAGRPHVAGILYELAGDALYVSTLRASRKARNVAGTPHVAVTVPIRRLPIGPPSTVQFQGRAQILALDDPEIEAWIAAGHLRSITSHGERTLPGGCFLRIGFGARLITYGLGMSLPTLIRHPLAAGGSVDVDALPLAPTPATIRDTRGPSDGR